MTFLEIINAVKENIEASTFPNLEDSQIKAWINSAQRWVCEGALVTGGVLVEHNFSFLETETQADTVDKQRRYELPSAADSILAFKADKNIELIDHLSYRHPLTKILKKDIEDKQEFKNLAGKGTPSHFCIEQGDLWLYKLPAHASNNNQAFTINMEYFAYLTDLSADGDTNILTIKYPEVLEFKATALGFLWSKDEQVGYYDGLAKEKLAEMITSDQMKKVIGVERGMAPLEGQELGA